MGLIHLIVILLLVGILLALINRYGPPHVDGKVLTIINVVVIVAIILFLLKVFGVFNGLHDIRVGLSSLSLAV